MTKRTIFAAAAAVLLGLSLSPVPGLAMGGDTSPAPAARNSAYDDGVTAVKREDYRKAVRILSDVVAKEPRHADALNYLGYSYRKLKDYDRAVSFYLRALGVDPDHKGANEYLGEAYVELGQIDKAKERLARLERVCGMSCEEYEDLARMIADHEAGRSAQQSRR